MEDASLHADLVHLMTGETALRLQEHPEVTLLLRDPHGHRRFRWDHSRLGSAFVLVPTEYQRLVQPSGSSDFSPQLEASYVPAAQRNRGTAVA